MASFFHPSLFVKECAIGKGIFTNAPIKQGEIVIDFTHGPGKYLNTSDAYYQYEAKGHHYIVQVDDDRYLVAVDGPELGDYINHSCEPSCGVGQSKSVVYVAMRDIEPGEEITFDYCMTEAFYLYRMDCSCGKKACRGRVTGSDWKKPELQRKYRGFFSRFVQSKIDSPWTTKLGWEVRDLAKLSAERMNEGFYEFSRSNKYRLERWQKRLKDLFRRG